MTDAIKMVAENVAAAKIQAEQGAAALETASSAVDTVRSRIADLDSERARIVAERKAGKTSPKHGPRLAEIDADLEGLREILSETAQAYRVAGAEFQRLQQAVTAAEYALERASDQALLGDLKQIASDLDARLVATIGEIAAAAKRHGLNLSPWYPSAELANGMRRLDLEKGGLHR